MAKKFYVTTPIYYINDKPHIGHAYTTIAADVLARYHKQQGASVYFSTGTDENSQKTVKAATAAKQEIKAYTDSMAKVWQQAWDTLGIKYDRFIRTTEPAHQVSVYDLLGKIEKKGDIYKGEYSGLYCEACEEFKKEGDLEKGLCAIHKVPAKNIKEENYFFKLSKYAKPILNHIEKNPNFIQPQGRRLEIEAFIKGGLEDISITRQNQKWGMPYPFDKSQVIYVWVEALINYLSAVGYPQKGYEAWWPTDVALVGKDIIRFHCVYWPAMLISAGLPLPKTILANGFLKFGGEKMSKSLGNVVDPLELAKKYSNDALRYVLLRNTPYGQDGEFTMERFVSIYNSDLANELGNLIQRTIAMINKYQQGVVSGLGDSVHDIKPYEVAMERFRFDKALEEIWLLIRGLNQYIDEEKPWEVAKKEESEHLDEILSYLVSNIQQVAKLLYPFLPETSDKITKLFASGTLSEQESVLFPKIEADTT